MNEDHHRPPASTETPSAGPLTLPPGAMGLTFSRRFRLLRSGATFNALVETEPRLRGRTYPPSRKDLRDQVKARALRNDRKPKQTHPGFVVPETASASSEPESDTPAPRWQHQCHICRNETTGVIDEEMGCETCALDYADGLG